LGVTSRDDDALHVQIVFDEVLHEVSDKVNMSFGYIKECVYSLCATPSMNLMRAPNVASGLTMNSMGYDVLQTGSIVRETLLKPARVSKAGPRATVYWWIREIA